MRSIRTKMILCMCLLLLVSMSVLSGVSVALNTRTTRGVLQQAMLETAEIAADSVAAKLEIFANAAEEAGMHPAIYNPDATLEEKQEALDRFCQTYTGITRGNVIGADGYSEMNETDYSDREYFKQSMNGKTWVSDPLIAKSTGAMSVIISAPIWKDGRPGTTVEGVVFLVPVETFLNDIVSEIKISANSGAQILNSSGTIVAHPDYERVKNQHNSIELAKSNPVLQAIADLEADQIKGNNGFGNYTMDGVEKFLAYAPIPFGNNWSIGVNAPVKDFMEYTYTGIRYTVVMLVVALALAAAISVLFATSIAKPVKQCAHRLALLARGDLSSPVPQSKKKDETGVLLMDLGLCVTSLHDMIQDVSHVLGEIAQGNLSVKAEKNYPGELQSIHTAQNTILTSLNELVGGIASATGNVHSSAGQISQVSELLAQNSVEQTMSISNLSQSMSLVAERAADSTALAQQVAEAGESVKTVAGVGAEQMDRMMQAVQDINDAGKSIEKVIKIIDDIAFQTNILALNAAVEAARAGQHGKGFSVVADEVRNLAAKSAEAARDTSALISDTIAKADEGYTISLETRQSLEQILAGIESVTNSIGEISQSSEIQSREIETVNNLLESQAQAVSQNSASSQETAASSQEMKNQADELHHMVSRFQVDPQQAQRSPDFQQQEFPSIASQPVQDAGFELAPAR